MRDNPTLRMAVIGAGAAGVIAVGALIWWLASPLWRTDAVSESFPVVISEEGELLSPSREEVEAMDEEERAAAQQAVDEAAADMPDRPVDEDMPAEPVVVLSGDVVGAGGIYEGSGVATIYQLEDGSHVLRLENFEVTNGPDLHVYLSGAPEPTSRGDVMTAPSVDLGPLKGNVGDQNYPIPAGVDVANVQSVVIYCVPFHVLFASATLGS